MSFDSKIKFVTSGMTSGDGLMTENYYSLFERMGKDPLWFGVDGADETPVVIMGINGLKIESAHR